MDLHMHGSRNTSRAKPALLAEDLFLALPDEGEFKGRSVTIYGEPIHESREDVQQRYLREGLESFLAHQMRHSVGSYVLVDATLSGRRIITSPGYPGGYIRKSEGRTYVATLLSSVLHADIDSVRFDPAALCYALTYVPNSTFGMFPMQTTFQGVTRLNSASVLDLDRSGVTSYSTYINLASIDRPASLKDAVLEVASKFADHYARKKTTPSVLFSGGADSLMIYLALEEVMGKGKVAPIVVQTAQNESLTNGHYRALPVAKSLGIELDLIAADWQRSENVVAETLRMMRCDHMNTRKPDLALADRPDVKTKILHGQNMDALASNNMTQLQANLERGLLSNAQMPLVTSDDKHLQQARTLLSNMQFGDAYLSDPAFQRETIDYYRKATSMTIADPEPGSLMGIVRGMVATQRPNLLNAPRDPFSRFRQADLMGAEGQRLLDFFAQPTTPTGLVDLLRFYGYGQLAMKRGCTLPLSTGTDVSFFAMSGPLISYFMGKPRALSAATSPKGEVYDVVEAFCGKTYSDLLSRDAAINKRLKEMNDAIPEDKRDHLLMAGKSKLDPEGSKLFDRIESEPIRAAVRSVYRTAVSGSDPESPDFLVFNQSISRVLLNIELLLEIR